VAFGLVRTGRATVVGSSSFRVERFQRAIGIITVVASAVFLLPAVGRGANATSRRFA
jgi:hypothetical protein